MLLIFQFSITCFVLFWVNRKEIARTFGITLTFSSTRSGLTRFEYYLTGDNSGGSEEESSESKMDDIPNDQRTEDELPFSEVHVKATDEVYYKRAVDYSRVNTSAFVYSVPANAGERLQAKDIMVTASHAILIGTGKQRAPVAVVGLLFNHKYFSERFFNATARCGSKDCKIKCSDETTQCLLVDNNGYIIVSEDMKYTGKLLAEFDTNIMDELVTNKVMIKKRIYDWQAVCIDEFQVSGPASFLLTPLDLLRRTIFWLWAKVSMAAVDLYLNGFIESIFAQEVKTTDGSTVETGHGPTPAVDETRKMTKKTKPRPCVQELELFEVNSKWMESDQPSVGKNRKCSSNACDQ